jgi:hypothetical protein
MACAAAEVDDDAYQTQTNKQSQTVPRQWQWTFSVAAARNSILNSNEREGEKGYVE